MTVELKTNETIIITELIMPSILNLNNGLSLEQEFNFRRKIRENEGALEVLVHPYYNDWGVPRILRTYSTRIIKS